MVSRGKCSERAFKLHRADFVTPLTFDSRNLFHAIYWANDFQSAQGICQQFVCTPLS